MSCIWSEQDSNLQPRVLPTIAMSVIISLWRTACTERTRDMSWLWSIFKRICFETRRVSTIAVNWKLVNFGKLSVANGYRHALCQFELSDRCCFLESDQFRAAHVCSMFFVHASIHERRYPSPGTVSCWTSAQQMVDLSECVLSSSNIYYYVLVA